MKYIFSLLLFLFYLIETSAQELNICTSYKLNFMTKNSSLDQLNKNILFLNVLEPLFKYSPLTSTLLPMHFKDWSHNKEYTKWRFELKQNIDFHTNDYFTPTRKLNVSDIFFSWSLIKYPQKYLAPWTQLTSFLDNIKKLNEINPHVFTLELHKPDADLIEKLKDIKSIVYSKEYYEKLSHQNKKELFWTWPISTGPYQLVTPIASDSIKFKRFERYHLGKTNIEKINIQYELSGQKRSSLFALKQCDIVLKVPSYELSNFESNKQFKIIQDTPHKKLWIYLNLNHNFFSNIKHRQWFLAQLKKMPVNHSLLGAWAKLPEYNIEYPIISERTFSDTISYKYPLNILLPSDLLPTQFFKQNLPLIFSGIFPNFQFNFTTTERQNIKSILEKQKYALYIDEGESIDIDKFVIKHSEPECHKSVLFPICFSPQLIANHSDTIEEKENFTQIMASDNKSKFELVALMAPLAHAGQFVIYHNYVEKIKTTIFNGLDLSLVKKNKKKN